jgi:hypothetical protein
MRSTSTESLNSSSAKASKKSITSSEHSENDAESKSSSTEEQLPNNTIKQLASSALQQRHIKRKYVKNLNNPRCSKVISNKSTIKAASSPTKIHSYVHGLRRSKRQRRPPNKLK